MKDRGGEEAGRSESMKDSELVRGRAGVSPREIRAR